MWFLLWLLVFVGPILLGCWIRCWSKRSMCKGEDKGVSVGFFLGWFLPSAGLLIGMIIGAYCMLSSEVNCLDDKITNPTTGAIAGINKEIGGQNGLRERVTRTESNIDHLMMQQQNEIVTKVLYRKIYSSAKTKEEKMALTDDVTLFLTSPAIFLEKHKDLVVVKRFENEINALNVKMKAWEYVSPPK